MKLKKSVFSRRVMCSTERGSGRLTAIPNDLGNIGRDKQGIEGGDRRVEALSRQVDGALNCSALIQAVSAK